MVISDFWQIPMTESPDVTPELASHPDFPAEVSARICRHMNQDHSEAVLLYAQGLAGLRQAKAATMEAIDREGMDLLVWQEEQQLAIRIEFSEPLSNSAAAHQHLVDLVQQAQHQLTDP